MKTNDTRSRQSQVRQLVTDRLVPAVNQFRRRQDALGRVCGRPAEARTLLARITTEVERVCRWTDQPAFAEAFAADAGRWATTGLHTPPDFPAVRAAYRPGVHGTLSLLVAPMTTTNGAPPGGSRMECSLILVDVPTGIRSAAATLDCRFARLLAGSDGYMRGNCVVCFSEQVAASPDRRQHFAVFFMNKFLRIYQRETLPVVRRLIGPAGWSGRTEWASDQLDPAGYYAARCTWAAAHEAYHQTGPRPLRDHLRVKLNWHCGLLEEVKVDARVAVDAAAGLLPDGDAVAEFVLADRMFRYPRHPAATRNFDAGTGVLMFEHLCGAGAIRRRRAGLAVDASACLAALADLADSIEGMEALPDGEYRERAEAFVRTLLPAGSAGERFAFPTRYAAWVRPTPPAKVLTFDSLPF
jgi:hypothetical protein